MLRGRVNSVVTFRECRVCTAGLQDRAGWPIVAVLKRVMVYQQPSEVIMIPRERSAYSAIVDRPPLELPNRGRLIVWTVVNLEFWDISQPMARQVLPAPTGQVLLPDVPNWAWHEYGMRVGVWRFFRPLPPPQNPPPPSNHPRGRPDLRRVPPEAPHPPQRLY